MGGQKAKPKPVYSHFLKFKKQVHLPTDRYTWGGGVQSIFFIVNFLSKVSNKIFLNGCCQNSLIYL